MVGVHRRGAGGDCSGHRRPTPPAAAPMPTNAMLLNVERISRPTTAEAKPPSAEISTPPELPAVAAPVRRLPSPSRSTRRFMSLPLRASSRPGRRLSNSPSVKAKGQPPPEYPPEAVINGEEGTVIVRLTVDQDGRVTDAVASSPCSWPLLNNAAVRAVRSTWRFQKGPVRSYEVSIQFQLNRHE